MLQRRPSGDSMRIHARVKCGAISRTSSELFSSAIGLFVDRFAGVHVAAVVHPVVEDANDKHA